MHYSINANPIFLCVGIAAVALNILNACVNIYKHNLLKTLFSTIMALSIAYLLIAPLFVVPYIEAILILSIVGQGIMLYRDSQLR